MICARGARALWIAALGAAAMLALSTTARADETCVECHREQRVARLRQPAEEVPLSIHGRHAVTCSNCHGGRPDEPSARAHDPAAGFQARFASGARPTVCGGCHSNAGRMAAVDPQLPTDQLELYVQSVHGRSFAAGNSRAATCATCHGFHDVRATDDPESPVAPRNVAATCGHCHSDKRLMNAQGLPHDEERQWRHSVHGRAYTQWIARAGTGPLPRTQRHPPTCNDCHQDHGIANRDAAIAGCMRCHSDMWRSFSEGPHRVAFQRMGFLPCVDCHGSHEIAPADASLIGVDRQTACRRCHSAGQRMFDTIRRLGVEVRAAEKAAENARAALSGAPLGEFESKLRPIDEARHALRLAVHTLDTDKIAAAATLLRRRAERYSSPPETSSEMAETVANWAPPVGLVTVGAVLLFFAYRRPRGGKK